MAEVDTADRAWDIMKKIAICSLVTRKADGIRSRPMAATVARDDHAIYFLTDLDGINDDEIEANPAVSLIFSDTNHQKYVHLDGTAEVSDDRDKIRQLWTPFAKAWWDSPEDPDIRLVRVTPDTAEYWDSPGKIATYAKMLAAAVTGARPKVGDNRVVAL